MGRMEVCFAFYILGSIRLPAYPQALCPAGYRLRFLSPALNRLFCHTSNPQVAYSLDLQ